MLIAGGYRNFEAGAEAQGITVNPELRWAASMAENPAITEQSWTMFAPCHLNTFAAISTAAKLLRAPTVLPISSGPIEKMDDEGTDGEILRELINYSHAPAGADDSILELPGNGFTIETGVMAEVMLAAAVHALKTGEQPTVHSDNQPVRMRVFGSEEDPAILQVDVPSRYSFHDPGLTLRPIRIGGRVIAQPGQLVSLTINREADAWRQKDALQPADSDSIDLIPTSAIERAALMQAGLLGLEPEDRAVTINSYFKPDFGEAEAPETTLYRTVMPRDIVSMIQQRLAA